MSANARSGKSSTPVMWVLAIWLGAALAVSGSGVFLKATPRMVAAAVWGLTLLTLLLGWKAPVDLPALVKLHLVRFIGAWFVVLYRHGRLPFSFGVVGGIGDVL